MNEPLVSSTVRPCLQGPADLPEFVTSTFDAVELQRDDQGDDHAHVVLRVGDSVIEVDAGSTAPGIWPAAATLRVQVADADATLARALAAGATALAPVQARGTERRGAFIDAGGNTWWVVSSA